MHHSRILTVALLVGAMQAHAALQSAGQGLPLKNGRPAVASVNGEPIYLDELLRETGPANRAALQQGRGTADELKTIDRLVTVKLIAQEAGRMGLVEIPEIQKQVEVTSREILREVLTDRLVKDVKPDPAVVDKLFRDSVREWKTESLLFQDSAAAARVRKELASGAAFADVSARALTAKTAKRDADNLYHKRAEYFPQIAGALDSLKAGQVSPVIAIPSGFVIVKVMDIRYPENREARAAATAESLRQKQLAFMQAHEVTLRRQYVVVNTAVLSGLNYEAAKPTLETLLKDTRVVATIKGAESVTVADLTDYLRMQLFHGSDQAAQRKRMNDKKQEALDATLARRLLNMEAARLGIDKTNEYRDRVTGYRQSLVFDGFVQKVIAPGNKVTEDEVKQYYNAHLKDYSYPGMLRLRSVAFTRRTAAEDAVKRLREGTDFNWLAANADGRAAANTPGLVSFDGSPVMTDSMPEGLQKALAGAKAGEFRLYASPEGPAYALAVQQVVGSTAKPYADVREEAANKLFGEKINKALEAYAAKLRAQSKVETYVRARS